MIWKNNFIKILTLAALIFQSVIFVPAQEDSRQLTRENNQNTQKRIALVIGNGSYTSARKLENPVNDANDMAATLLALGFEVISGTDLSLRDMTEKVREFGDRLRLTKGVGLFYYAGHGVQVKGNNYLIPVDAEIPREDEVEFATMNLSFVMSKMGTANNGLNVVILDACRNNPFARSWSRSAEDGGLAQVVAPTGTFIAYATAPNMTASDGDGRNGLYTAELLKYLKQPGLNIEQAFKNVTIAVDRVSGGKQIPWTSSSLRGEFYFNSAGKTLATAPPETSASIAKPAVNPPKTDSANRTASATETASWDLVKDSNDASYLELFLKEFPDGVYQAAARLKIKKIEQDAWEAVRNSENSEKIQSYLSKYPNGENAPLARIVLKRLGDKQAADEAAKAVIEANTTKPGTIKTNSMGIEFVWIPPGEFMMGSTAAEVKRAYDQCVAYNGIPCDRELYQNEMPQRKITIKEGFWMGKYEVTQQQYQQLMGKNPSNFDKKCGARCPVENITWENAKEFVQKLNAAGDGFIYSLPSEAEWEYAARAGTTTANSFGDSLDATQANFYGVYPYGAGAKEKSPFMTSPVGSYQPNAWGLYDMHGNVAEYVEDLYAEYMGLPLDGSPNLTVGKKNRVIRGGSWNIVGSSVRSASRSGIHPETRMVWGTIGFRIVARPAN